MTHESPSGPQTLADYEHDAVRTPDSLTEVYGEPWQQVVEKVTDHVDELTARYLRACSLVFLGSWSAEGKADVSPRGGAPGFVSVLSEKLLAIPDAPGNNRLDTMRNLTETGRIGAVFLIPGRNDVVRVNGKALVTRRPELLDRLSAEKPARLAILIEPDEIFVHCPRALRRSNAWDPQTWPAPNVAPKLKELYEQHLRERQPV